MEDKIKVLVVEDELTNAILLKRILTKAGYEVSSAHNGADALKILEKEDFRIILTDWMMPQVDGIELIRQVRKSDKPMPLIIMVTALVSEGARSYAMESGADEYIAKPIDVDELLNCVRDGYKKHTQEMPQTTEKLITRDVNVKPPLVGVAVATSTGGPPALLEFFSHIDSGLNAAYFVVQHGPSWMLETFSQRLSKETKMEVSLGTKGLKIEPGNIYIAPGDKHMTIDPDKYTLNLDDSPKVNFVRPAADPLFSSVAKAFGKYSSGVVLTGLGKDGAMGAAEIASVKGSVFIQDPDQCVAPSMPRAAIKTGVKHEVSDLKGIASKLNGMVTRLALAI